MTNTVTKKVENELSNLSTKSAKIRHLSASGLTRSEIAKYMQIRYQHVRNVLVNPPKKQS